MACECLFALKEALRQSLFFPFFSSARDSRMCGYEDILILDFTTVMKIKEMNNMKDIEDLKIL